MVNETCEFIKTYANKPESININRELLDLYETWYRNFSANDFISYKDKIINLMENLRQNYENFPNLNACLGKDVCRPALLTCTDTYLDKRIITFGKEANDNNSSILDDIDHLNGYLTNSYYEYEYSLIDRCRLGSLTTNYEKARFNVLGSLNNNLNKVSFGGKYTPVYFGRDKKTIKELESLYTPFAFKGKVETIFIHELRILKPKLIILWCGTGYDQHIKRAFGDEAGNFILKYRPSKVNSVSNLFTVTLGNRDVKMVFSYHPSCRLTREKRREYFDKLKALHDNN